jgi:DNA-binding NarL/FixJ family response regulator
MRDGLKTILELEPDMEVVGTAKNGAEAVEMAAALQPHVVLMDIRMPMMNGIESLKQIKREFPEMQVLMLTTFDEDDYIVEALANGANGFLLKDMPSDKLIEAVREGAKGQTMLPSPVAAKLAARLSAWKISPKPKSEMSEIFHQFDKFSGKRFTEREQEIIYYMVRNLNNRKIAERLGITEGTLKNYITSIYDKIGTNNRLEAIEYFKRTLLENREERL